MTTMVRPWGREKKAVLARTPAHRIGNRLGVGVRANPIEAHRRATSDPKFPKKTPNSSAQAPIGTDQEVSEAWHAATVAGLQQAATTCGSPCAWQSPRRRS
jgi:hypothetical protein